jgi:translation initiation factor 1A
MLGNGRVYVKCFDEVLRVGHIRGKMRRKVWIQPGDLVLCSLREFQNRKCDVVLKYLPDEVKQLKAQGQIPEESQDTQSNLSGNIRFADQANGHLADLSQSDSDSDSDSQSSDSGDDNDIKKKINDNKIDISAI